MTPSGRTALLLVALCTGCAPAPTPADADTTRDTADSEADGRLPATVEATWSHAPVACADPGARATLGPYFEWSSDDWARQHIEENTIEDPADGGWGLAVEDFDGDGTLDLYLPHFRDHGLWLADGDGWRPQHDGLSDLPEPFASGAAAGDLDGDGRVDLVLAGGKRHVLRNLGDGEFRPISPGDPPLYADSGGSYSTALGDIDGDGDLDVLAPMMAELDAFTIEDDLPQGAPTLLGWNDGAGALLPGTAALPAATNDGYPFQATLIDADGDADLDIYVANDHGTKVRSNRLWRNDGGAFTDWSEATGADLQMNAMGAAVGDLNDDGLPDFALSGIYELVLAESSRDPDGGPPTWVRTGTSRGLGVDGARGQEVAWGLDFGDVDNDGDLDLWVGFGHKTGYADLQPNALHRYDDGQFDDVGAAWGLDAEGETRGGILVDLDRDGWLDLVTRELDGPARLYRARCGDAAWLVIQPRQPGPNARAVGARVEVELPDRVLTRWVMAGGHSLSVGGPAEVHVGLGDLDAVQKVRVVWPDGEVSVVGPVPTRGVVQVARGAEPAARVR